MGDLGSISQKHNQQILALGERILHYLVRLVIAVHIIFMLVASLDNFRFAWKPMDLVEETLYLISIRPQEVPESFPSQSQDVRALVDPAILPAFSLLQQDPWFGYLAQIAIDQGIPIRVGTDGCADNERACYINSIIGCTEPGRIIVTPAMVGAPTSDIAEALVHELTHAQNRLERPSYYCAGLKYVSDELAAYSNGAIFFRKYTRWPLFDFFDHQGVLHDYCLYYNIVKDYPNLFDDVGYQPPSGMFAKDYCGLYSYEAE